MNILERDEPDPVGAAALLAAAGPEQLARFHALEDALWDRASVGPTVLETVRLRSAHLRGCAFCSAVRIRAGGAAALSEEAITRLDDPRARLELSDVQQAALTLVDRYLGSPRAPTTEVAEPVSGTLGSQGVMEVLVACAAFASADLRIALGENRAPADDGSVSRAGRPVPARSAATAWPVLTSSVLDPERRLPHVHRAISSPIQALVAGLWAEEDIAAGLLSSCVERSAQLLGVAPEEPVHALLVPERAASRADPERVRAWPTELEATDRAVMALAEQLWLDPSGVDAALTEPLLGRFGVDGVIRVTWALIWVGQLHRLTMVLHRGA